MTEELPHPGALVEGRYRIVDKIGEGGHGVVYRARRDKLDRVVALKVVPNHDADSRDLDRLRREVFHASGLTHPNTVTVYDYGTTPDGHLYIAMEYLPGLNLGEWLVEYGALEPRQTTDAVFEILDSLAEAHRNGIVHRDLKPGNIIVQQVPGPTRRLELKLLDFGLSKYVGDSDGSMPGLRVTQEGRVYGTPQYMAPEQAVGDEVVPATDIYTVGLLGYEMASGDQAFAGDSRQTIMRRQIDEPLPELPDRVTGTPLEKFIHICTKKAPGDRFENAGLARKWLAGRVREFRRLDTLLEHSGTPREAETPESPSSGHQATTPPAGMEPDVEPPDISRRIADLPLIDRTDELEAAVEWTDLAATEGGVLWLTGPPGVGKSRLLEEVVEELDRGERLLTQGRFRRSVSPVKTIRELFVPLVGTPDRASRPRTPDVSVDAARDAARRELGLVEERDVAPQRRTAAGPMFQGLVQYLAEVARQEPLLFVLDDFHHASGMAVGLVRRLVREFRDRPRSPVGLLLCGRSQELRADALIAELLGETASADAGRVHETERVLEVEPLADDEAQNLLDHVIALEPSLRETLVRQASGNPLYLAQIVRYLVEQDLVVRGNERRYELRERDFDLDELVPPSLLGLSRRRLRSLARRTEAGADPIRALTRMAVLGDRFESSLLERMLDEDSPERDCDLAAALQELRELDIIRETTVSGETGYAFADSMFRKAVLETLDLDDDERARLHELAARTKVRHLGAKPDRRLSDRSKEIGRHLEKSGDVERAVDWYLRSASRFETLGDDSSALEDLRAAERLLARGRPGSREELQTLVDIRLEVARLSRRTGKFGPAEDSLRAALEEARALDTPELEADLSHRLAEVLLQRADYDASRRYYRNAERLRSEADRPEDALRAALGEADVLHYRGDNTAARSVYQNLQTRAESLDHPQLEAHALLGLARCALASGELDAAHTMFASIFDRVDPETELRAQADLEAGLVELYRSGPVGALERVVAGLEAARRHGDLLVRARAHLYLGMTLRRTAQLELASRHADRARTLYERAAHRWGIGKAVLLEAELAWVQGDPERGAELANDSRDLHRDLEDVHGLALSLSYEGMFLNAAGRSEEARETLLRALAIGSRSKLELYRSRTLLFLGMVEEAEHEIEQAQIYYVDAAETARSHKNAETEILAEINLATLDLVRGKIDGAADTMQTYREQAERRGHLYGVLLGRAGEAWIAQQRGDDAAFERITEELVGHLDRENAPDLQLGRRLFQLAQLIARRARDAASTSELQGLERLLRAIGADDYAHRLDLQLRTISEAEDPPPES